MIRYLSSPTGIISPSSSILLPASSRRSHLMCGIWALRTRQSRRAVSPAPTVRLAGPNRISGCMDGSPRICKRKIAWKMEHIRLILHFLPQIALRKTWSTVPYDPVISVIILFQMLILFWTPTLTYIIRYANSLEFLQKLIFVKLYLHLLSALLFISLFNQALHLIYTVYGLSSSYLRLSKSNPPWEIYLGTLGPIYLSSLPAGTQRESRRSKTQRSSAFYFTF